MLINIMLISIVCYSGHITKFTNSSTIFRTGEPYTVYFTDNTKDFFGNTLTDIKYIWDFGDGHTSNNTNPIYRYSKLGKYNISLTVIDTINHFTSDYFKQITISNFKDTCTINILDTINIVINTTVYDTIFNYVYDTIFTTIVDTIYIVNTTQYELLECNEMAVYTIEGKYIITIVNSNFNILPNGTYIVRCNNKFIKILKQ